VGLTFAITGSAAMMLDLTSYPHRGVRVHGVVGRVT